MKLETKTETNVKQAVPFFWVSNIEESVRIADMTAATAAAIDRWPSRQALIVADDHPAPWRDVLTYVCAVAGGSLPQPGGRALMPSFRVTNRRARESLSWTPLYADYRAGLAR